MIQENQHLLPVIGISASLFSVESGCFMGRERMAVLQDYSEAIRLTGGIPIILPIVEGENLITQQMSLVDGLLLSGGYDVSPLFYGEEPQRGLEAVRPERDRYELQLIDSARKSLKPIFGICRGLQILNVAFGGTLYQDIPSSIPTALQHQQLAQVDEATHHVQIVSHTKLHHIFEEGIILTNSFHHQAIKDLAPGFIVSAKSSDGMIEGIEGKEDAFVLGVQWHPELMIGKHPKMFKLFRAFVEAAKQAKNGSFG